jgi:glycyl-tRNA synthetase beta chain
MTELLLELFSEEIPARMQQRAAEDLARLIGEGLAANGLSGGAPASFVTPRRLTVVIDNLPAATPDISEERRGPRVGAPAAAIDGFLKGAGVTLEQCERRDTGKGEFHFAIIRRPGRPGADVVREIVEQTLANFPWPKSMRWGAQAVRWVRPLQGIVCLFDGKIVPVEFGSVVAGAATRGHRFMAPAAFSVTGFADYRAKLAAAKVMLDAAERRRSILDQAEALAAGEGLRVRPDEGLLAEVTGLVEWPSVLAGTIDHAFLDLPDEVLITSMRAHQKYLSLLKADGRLADRFLVVSNMAAADGGAAIIAGNERVLRARLADAKFFWETDRKTRLDSRVARLGDRIFYQGLGSVADKVGRMVRLASFLATPAGADAAQAERAAFLAKADLGSEMVGEFPELQGVMGRYYAAHDGEAPAVAQAIAEHYAPQGPNDTCPTSPVSLAVALADKLDTLVGFFAIDEKPTGSKDPFALRRAALGLIRLILENGLRLPLKTTFRYAHAGYAGPLPSGADDTADELMAFVADRLKVHLREQGVRHDLVAAVFALGNEDDLVRLVARVNALKGFLSSDDGANLLTAYRRAANIVRIEEKKDGRSYGESSPVLGPDALPEELALANALTALHGDLADVLVSEQFEKAMTCMAALRIPVDSFFERVTVNCAESLARERRLQILARVRTVMNVVADFASIDG